MSVYHKIIIKNADTAWAQQMALAVGQDFAQRHYQTWSRRMSHLYWYKLTVKREVHSFQCEITKGGTIVVDCWTGWEPEHPRRNE